MNQRTNRPCWVCGEKPPRKLPHCDLTPLALPLPDVHLCFWCRRDLLQFVGDPELLDENQVTRWIARWLAKAASRKAHNLPLRRCEVGNGRGRCVHFAIKERDGLWICGRHANPRFSHAPRHYLDWRCQRLAAVDDQVTVIPPRPRLPRPPSPRFFSQPKSQKGSANGNARLSEADVSEIRELIGQGHYNTTIAARYGVTHSQISLIRRGKSWKLPS